MSDRKDGASNAPAAELRPVAAVDTGRNGRDGQNDERNSSKQRVQDLLPSVRLFRTPEGEPFASVMLGARREALHLEGLEFRRWLQHAYYKKHDEMPPKDLLEPVIGTLSLRARYESPEEKAFVRYGKRGEAIYVDLADDHGRAIEITADGFGVINEVPVNFIRPRKLLRLPVPTDPGNVFNELAQLLNVKAEADLRLIIAWLLSAMHPSLQCPVLAFIGEAGSSKSVTTRLVKQLIDPSSAKLRKLPRNERDLFVAANSSHVLAFDNISTIPDDTSDSLCQIVTGASFTTRKLYTDSDEIALNARNPLILNGIGNFIERSDLRDRAIQIFLDRIEPTDVRSEEEVDVAFDRLHPKLLALLCGSMSVGLRMLPQTRLDELPRMADFARWSAACEGGLGWMPGIIAAAFRENQKNAAREAIDADPLLSAFVELMRERLEWCGTSTALLGELRTCINADDRRRLPEGPIALGKAIVRATTSLRQLGIEIDRAKRGAGSERIITIWKRG